MDSSNLEIVPTLSVYELQDLLFTGTSTSYELLAIYISIMSAFFVAAYYFGNKLSKIELIISTSVYSTFCALVVLGLYQTLARTVLLVSFGGGIDNTIAVYITIIVMIVAWALSVLFMYQRSQSK